MPDQVTRLAPVDGLLPVDLTAAANDSHRPGYKRRIDNK